MQENCVTKEVCKEKHDASGREFKTAKELLKEHEEKLREADIRFAELSGDVKHIKDRIDNGLSTTICQIKEKMDEFIPLVRDSSEWAGRFKQAVFYVAVISFGGGIISLAFHLAAVIAEKVIK